MSRIMLHSMLFGRIFFLVVSIFHQARFIFMVFYTSRVQGCDFSFSVLSLIIRPEVCLSDSFLVLLKSPVVGG